VPSLLHFRTAFPEAYASVQVIAIDEAQFFNDLAEFCISAADHDAKRVVLAGLDGDFMRRKFGQVLDLIPHADSVTKLKAACAFCKQELEQSGGVDGAGVAVKPAAAVFSLRMAADSRQELVGGADTYAPVCRRHYVELTQTAPAR